MDYKKITIDKTEYDYKLRISKKARYMRLQVSTDKGLEVIVPYGISFREVERFLTSKGDWVVKHLKKISKGQENYLFFGRKLGIEHRYDESLRRHRLELNEDTLRILSPEGDKASLGTIYSAWLRLKAEQYIPGRVREMAARHGFRVNKITIRGQKTRWGSCSRGGNLSFNFKLMSYSSAIIDYVIVHELCHLKEMNHSKDFWNLVEGIVPDYKMLRKELKKVA